MMEKAEYSDDGKTLEWVAGNVKEFTIPAQVKHMKGNPFFYCGATIKSESDEFVIIGEGLYSKSKRKLIHCFTLNDTFRVADGTLEIGMCAFPYYKGDYMNPDEARGEVILPPSVKKIDDWAFDECNLRRLVINGKIDEIVDNGPVDTYEIQEISVPKGLGSYYNKLWFFHAYNIKERKQ